MYAVRAGTVFPHCPHGGCSDGGPSSAVPWQQVHWKQSFPEASGKDTVLSASQALGLGASPAAAFPSHSSKVRQPLTFRLFWIRIRHVTPGSMGQALPRDLPLPLCPFGDGRRGITTPQCSTWLTAPSEELSIHPSIHPNSHVFPGLMKEPWCRYGEHGLKPNSSPYRLHDFG